MAWRCTRWRILMVLFLLSASSMLLSLYTPQADCDCQNKLLNHKNDPEPLDPDPEDHPEWGQHKLAVIVPFRNRFEELLEFVPYMHGFLNKQKIRHKIFVLNQADSLRFNRGYLINIGYLQSRLECDYIAMHDVDLMPQNPQLNYSYPAAGPYHVAAPDIHPMYHYPTFVGGILLIANEHFHSLNGMSNRFWGWGREDDEFYLRIKDEGLEVRRPKGLKTTYKNTFRHLHDKYQHPRDYSRIGQQRQKSKRDHFTGVDTVQYGMMSRKEIMIEGTSVTILNVRLECDLEQTPWCMTLDQLEKYLSDLNKKDPDRAAFLTDKLFGTNGLMIAPPPKKKTTTQKNNNRGIR